jgi:phosphinothricin acetyltransferase
MNITFEPLAEKHRIPVIDIFNHYIENTYAAYLDRKVPYDFYDLFLSMMKGYPSAALLLDGGVAGFCFLRAHNPLPAFARTADITYFLRHDLTGKGLGAKALEHLEVAARPMGIDTIMASVSSLNDASIRFHAKNGFSECGRFSKIGRKFGRDFDVVWFQKFI